MTTIGLLAGLALAISAPATAKPTQCVRTVDRAGNIRVVCPNINEARAEWATRHPTYAGNYVVYYQNGKTVKEWKHWLKKEHEHDKDNNKR